MAKINPFKPNSPISSGMFVGRLEELDKLETHLLQTRAGSPSNFMITGERGIGKSSLLNFVKAVAEGDIPIGDLSEAETVRFLVIDTDIDQSTTQLGLLKKIELGLRMELAKNEPTRKFFADAWGFLKRVEAAGIKLRDETALQQNETVIEEFSYSLADTACRICSADEDSIFKIHYDGILILIDEADNGSKELGLGSFLKLLLERLQRRNCNVVMVGLAGLPHLHDVLMSSHESSLRLFEEIILSRLSDNEVDTVIDMCLTKANRENKTEYKIEKDARGLLRHLSEGYPHFIQQFGFSAFAHDTDKIIDIVDVEEGAFSPRGALDVIGDRYYRNDFYNKIQQESYRQVLRIMSNNLDGWVSKRDIRKKFKGNDSTLDNAIRALRERHIILSKEGEKGVYRLQHKGFAYWIKLKTSKHEELQTLFHLED
ncbi:MAG: ATP-binding protein [Acidobacteriota bacterium]|nr:ATP-binding protein [Acidobacteriota bacterium]